MYVYSFLLYGDACCIESLSGEQEASADLSTFLLFIGEEVKVDQSDVLLNLHTSEASVHVMVENIFLPAVQRPN
jgi:hypothetical protein